MSDREHLDHLPGRAYVLVVGATAAVAVGLAAIQMVTSSDWASTVLWGLVLMLGVVSLISLAVAWEERRAHIHALVRQALDSNPDGHSGKGRAAAMAELARLGAHRETAIVGDHLERVRGA